MCDVMSLLSDVMLSCFAFWRNFQLSSNWICFLGPCRFIFWMRCLHLGLVWLLMSRASDSNPEGDERTWIVPVCRTNKDYCYLTLQCSSWNLWTQFQVRARSTWSPQLNPTPTAVDPDRNSVDHSSWSRSIWFSTMLGVIIRYVRGHFDYCYSRECWYRCVRMIRCRMDGWARMVVRRKCGCVCEARANENASKIQQKWKKSVPNTAWSLVPAMAWWFGSTKTEQKREKKVIKSLWKGRALVWGKTKTGKINKPKHGKNSENKTRGKLAKPKQIGPLRTWVPIRWVFLSVYF